MVAYIRLNRFKVIIMVADIRLNRFDGNRYSVKQVDGNHYCSRYSVEQVDGGSDGKSKHLLNIIQDLLDQG